MTVFANIISCQTPMTGSFRSSSHRPSVFGADDIGARCCDRSSRPLRSACASTPRQLSRRSRGPSRRASRRTRSAARSAAPSRPSNENSLHEREMGHNRRRRRRRRRRSGARPRTLLLRCRGHLLGSLVRHLPRRIPFPQRLPCPPWRYWTECSIRSSGLRSRSQSKAAASSRRALRAS